MKEEETVRCPHCQVEGPVVFRFGRPTKLYRREWYLITGHKEPSVICSHCNKFFTVSYVIK